MPDIYPESYVVRGVLHGEKIFVFVLSFSVVSMLKKVLTFKLFYGILSNNVFLLISGR